MFNFFNTARTAKVQALVLEHSSLGVALVHDRKFSWVNGRVGELLGMPVEAIVGQSARCIYPSDEAYQELGRLALPAIARGERSDNVLQLRRADGSLFWCRFIGKAVDPSRPQEGIVWMLEDISRQREAEKSAEEQAVQSIVLENTTLALVLARDRKIVWANSRLAQLFGKPIETLVGQLAPKVLYPSDEVAEDVGRRAFPVMARGERWEDVLRLRRGDGAWFWCRMFGKAVDASDPSTGILWIMEDITEARQAEDAKRHVMEVVTAQIGQLKAASVDLEQTSRALSADTAAVATHAGSAAASAAQVSQNELQVASSVEEISASITEISKNTSEAAKVAEEAAHIADRTAENVRKLDAASEEIRHVIDLISGIARQTNLLALNATIEAARAGEAGKGFAVVAGEVKELARQTAGATEQIDAKINAIRERAAESTAAITQIDAIVRRINSAQHAIAVAVEEQSATMSELNRAMSHSASDSGNVSASLAEINELAKNTNTWAGKALASGQSMAGISRALDQLLAGDAARTGAPPSLKAA